MRFNVPDVSQPKTDWQREETRFLVRYLTPALCIQLALLSLHATTPVDGLTAVLNLLPAAVLLAYLGRVLYHARKDGQVYPWGRHD